MSKTLKARCIRRWEIRFRYMCDSKFSPIGASEIAGEAE